MAKKRDLSYSPALTRQVMPAMLSMHANASTTLWDFQSPRPCAVNHSARGVWLWQKMD